jgi:hypothetical protein
MVNGRHSGFPGNKDSCCLALMTAYLLTDHILNLVAPAAFVALALFFLARLFSGFSKSKKGARHSLWVEVAIIFVANIAILVAGLIVFGNDGKMATYAAMVLASATSQWVLGRGWRPGR